MPDEHGPKLPEASQHIRCWACNKSIVPSVVVRNGSADHSVCPFCGATISEFTLFGRAARAAGEMIGQWREHLWGMHTGGDATENIAEEYKKWGETMDDNSNGRNAGLVPTSHLIEFFDDQDAWAAPD